MGQGLLSLLLLVSLISFAAAMEVTCTRLNRKCIPHTPCYNRTCVCPSPRHGDALLACAEEDEDICMVKADPHARSYGLAKGNVPYPCRYRLAAFQVQAEGREPGFGCSFEIFAFNVVSQSGKYFTAGAEVKLRLGPLGNAPPDAEYLKFEINHAGIVSNTGSIMWGAGYHSTTDQVTISCDFEIDQNFAIFHVKECGTTVRFRPYRESDEPFAQVRMPGIAVISPKRAIFGPRSGYPDYLCGTPTDSESLYRDRGEYLRINSSHAAILHDVLLQGCTIGHNLLIEDQTKYLLPNAPECARAIDAFKVCNAKERPLAVHYCMKIMSSRKLIRCFRRDVLQTFIFCLEAFCQHPKSCRQLTFNFELAMEKDRIQCRPPHRLQNNVNCTFKV